MSTNPIPAGGGDARLMVVAGLGVAVAVAAVVARLVGVLPSSAATLVALVGTVIGLRVALLFAARSASSPSRARTMLIVSLVGLGISGVTLLAALPRVTSVGGFGKLAGDVFAYAWVLIIFTAVAAPVRTLGWRAFAGAGLVGFLGISSLSRVVGTPVVNNLGGDNLFAVAV